MGSYFTNSEDPQCKSWGCSWLPLHPAPRGGTSSQVFAEFGDSESSAPRDAPEARPAGLEEAEDKTKQPVKMPFSLQEIKAKRLDQRQQILGNPGDSQQLSETLEDCRLCYGKTSRFTLYPQRHCILGSD